MAGNLHREVAVRLKVKSGAGASGEVIIGTMCATLDGALCGGAIGWRYYAAAATATPRR